MPGRHFKGLAPKEVYMNKNALFCDGTSDYVIPAEPGIHEKVRLRFRTARDDAQEVCLISGGETLQMQKMSSGEVFDYYETEVQLTDTMFVYYFRIKSESEELCYHRCGVSEHPVEYYNFRIMPGFSTPAWAKGAVMYQIFVDRFCNGDPSNDVEDGEYVYIGEPVCKVKDWNEFPAAMDIRRFHGGDLQGVLDKLDYLEELGVEVIYFNPLFVSPSNHKYDIQDYDYIDPHYGVIIEDGGEVLPEGEKDNTRATKYQKRTGDIRNLEASNRLFAKLVEEMHTRGMRVILDGVFNHCGSFNKWMDRERIYEPQPEYEKGAYVSAQSPYRDFFHFFDEREEAWPYNKNYDGWWGHDTLPKLNYEDSPTLEEYILNIGKKWVSPPYNADGWRLDVAADLGYSNEYNHIFWENFRKAVKSANPQALILAEHYGDPGEWLQGDEWDSVMNYDAFMEPLTWFLTGMEKHSDERRTDLWGNADNFVNTMNHFMASMLTPSLQVAMNELSNHDHSRFLTRTNHIVGRMAQLGSKAAEEGINLAVMREAVAVQMTWVGAPTVYYGDEAGVCGFTDPDSRRTYPWGQENRELVEFHKEMIRIHKREKPLRTGSLKMLSWSSNVLAYARFQEGEQIIVVLNNSKELKEVTIPVWQAEVPMKGKMERLMYSWEKSYTTERDIYLVEDGETVVNMGKHSVLIMKPVREMQVDEYGKESSSN
jgi:glycosidase